jgi:hypothetical protein
MVSVPTVNPGDMVFWHCDVVHAVEEEHRGVEDSAGGFSPTDITVAVHDVDESNRVYVFLVMYIPSVPLTPQNLSYLARQREAFEKGRPPPDFPQGRGEAGFVGLGREEDVVGAEGRRAMGLVY